MAPREMEEVFLEHLRALRAELFFETECTGDHDPTRRLGHAATKTCPVGDR
jgi:hypothetical protein